MFPNYVCPVNGCGLKLQQTTDSENEDSVLVSEKGLRYSIIDDIPNFTFPQQLGELQQQQLDYYQACAENYDDVQHLTFDIQRENEKQVRENSIKQLNLRRSSKVLEIACGTGKDSEIIADQLDDTGELFLQDISSAMINQCRDKLINSKVQTHFSVGNASYLPFEDDVFDAIYSFGGLNVFDDKKKSLQEMVRVTKPGGRIVVGDESMPPWLYETEFGKILLNNNKLFKIELPLNEMPIEAREVCVRWIIGGVYYLIDFTVGKGEPNANFDMEIPGSRGGTLNSRYFGQLEGVSVTTKVLAEQAAKNKGISHHQWLNEVVLNAARSEIDKS